MSRIRFALPRPPEEIWKRRLILAVAGFVVLASVVLALHGGSTTAPDVNQVAPSTVPSTVAAPSPTTTVDPKAIQAGVAALLAREGATPQELASVPASGSAHGSGHHGKSSSPRTHH